MVGYFDTQDKNQSGFFIRHQQRTAKKIVYFSGFLAPVLCAVSRKIDFDMADFMGILRLDFSWFVGPDIIIGKISTKNMFYS